MDLLKFYPGTNPTELAAGATVVGGYDSLMWVERYRKAGEFKLTAPLASGLLDILPLNTFVSIAESLELMLVENHILKEKKGTDPVIEISGRSFDAWLENRIVGMEQFLNSPSAPLAELFLAAADSWDQVVTLINTHIDWDTIPVNKEDSLPGMVAVADDPGTLTGLTPTNERRTLKRGSVHARVLELLAVDDLGIRLVRRNPFGVLGDPTDTWLLVHAGSDRSGQVIFSSTVGDLDSADYLWSTKTDRNCALVTGRHFELSAYSSDWNFNRRSTLVDGSDIDGIYTDAPVDPTKATVLASMATRGYEELARKGPAILTRADVSAGAKYAFRKDYDIGDIVSIDGSYGEIVPRRVTEYTQIQDKDGESGHPTLEALNA
jgi:hypothetical protein